MRKRRAYRILMICPQFRPIVGGYERSAERLSIELGRLGHKIDVVTERRDMRWPKEEKLYDMKIRRAD